MATHKIKKYSFILLVITFSSIATINTNFSSLNIFKLNLFIENIEAIASSEDGFFKGQPCVQSGKLYSGGTMKRTCADKCKALNFYAPNSIVWSTCL